MPPKSTKKEDERRGISHQHHWKKEDANPKAAISAIYCMDATLSLILWYMKPDLILSLFLYWFLQLAYRCDKTLISIPEYSSFAAKIVIQKRRLFSCHLSVGRKPYSKWEGQICKKLSNLSFIVTAKTNKLFLKKMDSWPFLENALVCV